MPGSYARWTASTTPLLSGHARWVAGVALVVLLRAGIASAETPLVPEIGASLSDLRLSLSDGRDPEAVHAIRILGTVRSGDRIVGSTVTVATRNPPALREVLDMSGVRQTVVLIGDQAWFQGQNGSVRRATGDELASYQLAHSLLFHSYLDLPPPGFEMQREPNALRFVPRGEGSTRTLELGRDGDGLLLPRRLLQRVQGVEVTVTLEDWRTVDGVRAPFRSVQSSGDPRFDLVLQATRVEFSDVLEEGVISPLVADPSRVDAFILDTRLAESIPLEKVGALLLVQGTVGTEQVTFLIDTGAGATVLSARLVDRLGLEQRGLVEARGAGGSEAGGYVDVERLSLPGVEIRDQTVVTLPLTSLREVLGRPIDGILGYDFLSRFALEIHYPQSTLRVFEAGQYEPEPGTSRVPLRLEVNVPRVEGLLDGTHLGSFVLDLGNATSLVLHTSFARKNGYLDRAHEGSFSLSGIGGAENMSEVTVTSLSIGDVAFRKIPAVIALSGTGALALDEALGNIGGALFAQSILAIDYSEGSLWIRPANADSASGR